MYYEEQLIGGVMHWRSDPRGKFEPYTLEQLSQRYMEVRKAFAHYRLRGEVITSAS